MTHGPSGWLERAKRAEQEVVRLRAQLEQAAIAAMQPAPQEPAAWMYEAPRRKPFNGTETRTSHFRWPDWMIKGWTETPLYAFPTPPAGGSDAE